MNALFPSLLKKYLHLLMPGIGVAVCKITHLFPFCKIPYLHMTLFFHNFASN